jgi:hypothetical protein
VATIDCTHTPTHTHKNIARGKGTRGKGRGASTSKTSSVVGTRANPNAMAEGEGNERSDMGERERVELTPSSSSGGAGTGESGAGKELKHEGKKRKRDSKSESDEEDWGFEGKSYWKSKLPQSVETAEYVHLQIPLPFKKGVWEGNYCDLTLFLPKENENVSGEKWTVEEGGFTRKIIRQKIKTIMQWVKCFLKYISLMMVQRIQETPAMISYMHTIIRAAETNPGLSWLFYDEQFRLKLVTHPDME